MILQIEIVFISSLHTAVFRGEVLNDVALSPEEGQGR